jgi:hypothetical protein
MLKMGLYNKKKKNFNLQSNSYRITPYYLFKLLHLILLNYELLKIFLTNKKKPKFLLIYIFNFFF